MENNYILELIEKAKSIINENEYAGIRLQYEMLNHNHRYSEKFHKIEVGRSKKLFESALKTNADDIDMKVIACYFLMCLDMIKRNIDINSFKKDMHIDDLKKIYMNIKEEE